MAHLRTLELVAKHGTFSGAAEQLGITQPAVSLHIRSLETAVGVKLVERVGKRTTPTRAGDVLVGHAAKISGYVDAAFAEVSGFQTDVFERVRIGTGATACIYLLPTVLGPLKQRYEHLQISVKTGDTKDILKEIEANTLDVGLVTMPARGAVFNITPILKDPFVAIFLAGSESLPDRVTPEFLAEGPLILYEAGGNTRRIADEWFRQADIDVSPVMDLGSVEAIKALVSAGLGRAILPKSATIHRNQTPKIAVRPLDPPLGRELAVVLRNDKMLTRGLRETVATLKTLGNHGAGSSEL